MKNFKQKKIKKDIVKSVSAKTGIIGKDVREIIDGLIDTFREELLEGNEVELRGFGRMWTIVEKPKFAVNVNNGEMELRKAKRVAKFRFSIEFREKLAPEFTASDLEK